MVPQPALNGFTWGGDGWLGADTYAGGADKLGHAWATMTCARAGTELLRWGGYDSMTASLIGAGLADLFFVAIEITDGTQSEFSPGDSVFGTAGALFAVAASNLPALDELVDLRIEYWPSRLYRKTLVEDGNLNAVIDYTGQTYLVAFHLGGIPPLRDTRFGGWTRFLDVAVGFGADGYQPRTYYLPQTRTLFLGLALNAQGIVDRVFDRDSTVRKLGHGLFEVATIPYTTLPIALVEESQRL